MPDTANQNSIKPNSKQSKLGVKLITYVLFFSFFVTLATSGYIIYSDYLQGTKTLNQSISQIQAGYQESISYSLWNFDSQQIKTQLAGIINFPGVLNVYIETKEGLLHSTGDFKQTYSEKYAFDLFYNSAGNQYPLGVLNITLDYQGLYKTLFYKALNILATQFIKTFSVSLFMLYIFQRLVTDRLIRMARWAQIFSLDHLDTELKVRTKTPPEDDEIDSVVSAINSMRISLKEDIQQRELAEQNLSQTQHKLSIAINNAELGFCEYNPKDDKFIGNSHFARHLELSPEELEHIENPADWFKERIIGEHCIEQRERINQLLHGHMEKIWAELTVQCTEHIIKYFDTTIQVSGWDDNGLPVSIVFCILDKTKQTIAQQQAMDLNVALEQKVTKRTEELSQEQTQSHAEIKKMQHQLASYQQYQSRQKSQQNLIPLQSALQFLRSNLSDTDNRERFTQSQELIELLSQHLVACNTLDNETFDITQLLKSTVTDYFHTLDVNDQDINAIGFMLPFSLMLDSYKHIIAYTLKHMLSALSTLYQQQLPLPQTVISLTLEKETISIIFTCRQELSNAMKKQWEKPDKNAIIVAKMCHGVMQELLDGSLTLTQNAHDEATLTLQFNLNVQG